MPADARVIHRAVLGYRALRPFIVHRYSCKRREAAATGATPCRFAHAQKRNEPELNVYIANFGRENYEWPRCLAGDYVATMQDERLHAYWAAGDRDGYIEQTVEHLKTAKGITPVKSTASRWYNLGTIIMETSGDLWIHRQEDRIWWTMTEDEEGSIDLEPDPKPAPWGSRDVYFYRKPCRPWSSSDELGRPLRWSAVHRKAHDFLTTEATLQKLGVDYAEYARALVKGNDLSEWHSRPDWIAKTETGRRSMPVKFGDARAKTFLQMVMRAEDTSRRANGQIVERRVKNKEFRLGTRSEAERYLEELFDAQEGLCALSGLQLQWIGGDDPQLCCSLDRIDSDGHYEKGNLQIVCNFINRWKSDGDNAEFSRLIAAVRETA